MTYAHPRRRHWPAVLLVLIVLVGAGLVGLDLWARSVTESAIASDVQRSTHAGVVTARIDSVPFLWDVAFEGRLAHVTVTGASVPAGPLTVDRVTVDARDVHFDRNALVSNRRVRITSVARADVTVVVRLSGLEQSVASALGVEVVPSGSDRLQLRAAGHTVATVDLTKIPLIPVCPLSVTHQAASYVLSCSVAPVPAVVLAALSHSV